MRKSDDRGVSESLGYVLIFAIVLTGIAGIVFVGVTILNDAKDRNNFQNVEQGLGVVQSDLKRVAMEKAPVKTSKLHIEGGSLATNFTAAKIRVEFNGNTYQNTTGEITFQSATSGLKTISIEDAGLWESTGPQSDLGIAPPRIFSSPTNGAIIINVIRLNGTASAIASAGTTNIVMEYAGNRVIPIHAPAPGDVTITVSTSYPNAWARFIQDSINGFSLSPITVTGDSMQVTISGVSEVIISEHTIDIQPFYTTS